MTEKVLAGILAWLVIIEMVWVARNIVKLFL